MIRPGATVFSVPGALGAHLARIRVGGLPLDSEDGQDLVLHQARQHAEWERTVRLLRASLFEQAHVVIRGVPVESNAAVIALCLVAGQPRPQPTPEGARLFFDVHSLAEPYSTSTTSDAFDLHTDGASCLIPDRVIALACCRADPKGGGRSLVMPLALIRGELERRHPDIALALGALSFSFSGEGGSMRVPLLWRNDGVEFIRWRSESVNVHPSLGRAPRRTAEAALLVLREVLRTLRPQTYALAPGDLLLVDNWRALHGRTAFAPGSQRWLRRVRCPTQSPWV